MASKIKVILLTRIAGLGQLGEEVAVSAGYARNWLLPKQQALLATEEQRAVFEARREQLEAQQKKELEEAGVEAEKWQDLALVLEVQAGPGGKMYGSVTSRDLAAALSERGLAVQKRQILLPQALRQLGAHSFSVQLHSQVRVSVSVTLVASGSSDLDEVASEEGAPQPPVIEESLAPEAETI